MHNTNIIVRIIVPCWYQFVYEEKRMVISSKAHQNQKINNVHAGLDWNTKGNKFL